MKTYRNSIYNHIFKNSSFIQKASWFNDTNILMLTFSTGSVWHYYDVPFEIYSAFTIAPSHGKYFNENIRNVYSGARVYYTSSI